MGEMDLKVDNETRRIKDGSLDEDCLVLLFWAELGGGRVCVLTSSCTLKIGPQIDSFTRYAQLRNLTTEQGTKVEDRFNRFTRFSVDSLFELID